MLHAILWNLKGKPQWHCHIKWWVYSKVYITLILYRASADRRGDEGVYLICRMLGYPLGQCKPVNSFITLLLCALTSSMTFAQRNSHYSMGQNNNTRKQGYPSSANRPKQNDLSRNSLQNRLCAGLPHPGSLLASSLRASDVGLHIDISENL